ncbi:hypothetical protein P4C99_06185 [Pontiellaceae bacterium B1224]|nr:hypothetical protein [Pontiellaceae bacterium B1224]
MKKYVTIAVLCLMGTMALKAEPMVLDMVHHNPGEPLYESAYNDPAVIQQMGYNGKVYFLFESPMLAINWESVDKDILPKGSEDRKWVDAKARVVKANLARCKKLGMQTYAMSDMVLFPKRLIEKEGLEETFGDARNPRVQELIRAQVDEMFAQFEDFDGLVVRIGETYLHDAPFHQGAIKNKGSSEKTIIPLMQLLREEVCVKRNKQLIFRTWIAFDRSVGTYMAVNDAVEPHPNLTISIKQCEGDFHRGCPFSKLIGMGRHKQIVEVQCAREYEGKGAYPNYIAHGVIEGFEEHERMPEDAISNLREFTEQKPELYAGIWTWTRGGGWDGPYITSELWPDLNAWVVAQWANDPSQSEEVLFNQYAREKLKLSDADVVKFRELCLLSADAVVRGRNTTHFDMDKWWTRDQGIGWPRPAKTAEGQARSLRQKEESILMWKRIVDLSEEIKWATPETREFVVGSAYYGLHLYEIYRAAVYLSDAETRGDEQAMKLWIGAYDEAWETYNKLPEQFSSLSTLYTKDYARHCKTPLDKKVETLRAELSKKK